jgi:hypothetical protein
VEECKDRVLNREKHPTLSPEMGAEVIDSFAKGLSAPQSVIITTYSFF